MNTMPPRSVPRFCRPFLFLALAAAGDGAVWGGSNGLAGKGLAG